MSATNSSNRMIIAAMAVCLGAASASADEFRAVACSRFQWPQKDLNTCKAYIDTLMQKLKDNNFNAVILQMRGQCDTLYPSPYEPWSYLLSSDGNAPAGWGDFDPMAYAINAAHANGLEFHAYLNACVAWNSAAAPEYCSRHIYWEHCDITEPDKRDWLLCDSGGTPVGFTSEYVWVAPGVPSFQAYWRKQIMYVVEHYNGSDPVNRPAVDGVHFDRARLPSNIYSYDLISQSRRLGEGNPAGLSFGEWTADQITRMLIDVYAQVNEYTQNISPTHHRVKVSSAPLGLYLQERYPGYPSYYHYGRSQCYQDAQAWLAAGAQDFICPQIYWADPPYRTGTPYFSDVLPDWLQHNSGRHVYAFCNVSATAPGLIAENTVIRTKTAEIGQGNAPGSVIWSYGTMTSAMWSAFSGPGGPYELPTNTPAMPWKDAPTDAIILGTVSDGANPIVDAQITRTGSAYTALSSADGLYSFLKVPPGTHTLSYAKSGLAGTTRQVSVAAGQVVRVPEVILGNNVPPQISDVQATSITNNAATITWTTNVDATSQVEYGTTTGYGSSTPLDSVRVTSHSVSLSGLTPNTLYHYRVLSGNDYGTSSSNDYTFTTVGPPTISNVQVTAITSTSATVTWTTNNLSTSQVRYGPTSSYGSLSPLDSAPVTSHAVVLTGLQADTTYHFAAVSTNGYGSAQTGDFTFTTLMPQPTPVIFNVAAGGWGAAGSSSLSAVITWTTDVPADTQVEYGLTSAYGSSSTLDPALLTSHSMTLNGLLPSMVYHYRVRSVGSGGVSYSGDHVFMTGIVIDNSDPGCTRAGAWNTGSNSLVPKVGTTYLFVSGTGSEGSTTATCRWTPNISANGNYDVYVYYQIGENRNASAPFTVFYKVGQVTSVQNQNGPPNNGGWFKVGSNLPFDSGTGGYVQAANNSTDPRYVSADAVLFVPHVRPDFDGDFDVDQADLEQFVACASGPSIPQSGGNCDWAKLDNDDDVDQDDFGIFQRCFSGPGISADPNCTD